MKYDYVFPIIGRTVMYRKGRDSIIGVVFRYGLEGSEFDPRCWQDNRFFSTPVLSPPS